MRGSREVSLRLEARTRARAASCGAGLALAAFAVAPPADAATSRASVAIVFADGIDERQGVVHDLELELRAEGFRVHSMRERDGDALDDTAERARGDGVLLHVVPGAAGDVSIEVLAVTADGLVLKDTIRRQAGDTSDIASVRAVEVTRAALIAVKKPLPPADPMDIVRDDPYAAVAPSRSPFLSVSVAPVLAIMGTTPSVLVGVGMNVGWSPSPRIALELEGAIPLSRASDSALGGTAYVKATFITAGASYFFTDEDRWLRPFVGARAGAVLFSLESAAAPFFVGTSQTVLSFFGGVAAGASFRIHDFVRLRADASIGFSTTRPVVYIGVDQVDKLGAPIALFSLGPEVTW